MNRIYRLVWNRALRVLQVASEHSAQRNGSHAAKGRCVTARLWLKPLAMAMVLATPWLGGRAYAACTPANPTAGATVTCNGAANPLAPSYSATANNLTVNVNSGASTGVLLGLGGTAMTLTGNNVTLNNAGTIDPSLLGLLSLLSSGTFIGNSAASTLTVNNQATGVMNGTSGLLGVSINGLTGMALATQNGTGGVTNITNAGSMGGNALLGVSLIPSDIPVVAAYGGAQINFTNTGTITGRVGFQASQTPGTGNTFANAGTINGGVSMGAASANTFTAVSGSSVNLAGGIGLDLNVLGLVGVTLGFAPTGVVDGGAGGNNTLVLQNVLPSSGTGSGTGGAVTSLSSGTYINFQHLRVNSGTWNLQGPLVSGDATLNGGLVNFNNGGVFGTGAVSANGGAIAASAGGLVLANNMTLGTGGLTIAGTNNFTLSGAFSGSGGLTQSSSGVTTLTGTHTYTGPTTISAGTLALASTGALPTTGPVNLTGATAIFDITGTATGATIGSLAGVAGSQVTLGPRTLTAGDAGNTTFAGSVSGTGGLIKQGTGTLSLAGANTYIGGTTVNTGSLAITGSGSLASTGAMTLGAGTTFDISGATANQTIGNLTGAAGSQVLLGARTLTAGGAASTLYAGVISGGGGLIKQGAGTLTLAGSNTYTGGTTINAGTLQGDTTSLQGNITDNASLNFNQAANGTFAGLISGTGNVVKQGAGTLTLTGANTYGGGTTVSAGALQGDTSSLQGNIANNAALIFNQAAAGTYAGNVSGTGSLTKTGAGTLTLSGTHTYTGGTTVSAGTLQGTTASLQGNIVDSAALVFNQATDGTFTGAISGSGSVAKLGTGTVTLSGANTYSGGTTVSAGTLQGDTTSLQGNIVDNATVAFNQTGSGLYAGVISGTGDLAKSGAGTLTLGGVNSYTGNTRIDAGTLALAAGSSIASSSGVTMAAGGTLDLSAAGNQALGLLNGAGGTVALGANTLTLNGAGSGTFGGVLTGSGGLVMNGAGTQTLTGANLFTGGTLIQNGTLALGAGGSLAAGSPVTLTGGVLDLSTGGNQSIANLAGTGGQVQLGGGSALTVDGGNFAGAITGNGSLIKAGLGNLVLDGASSYSGGTQVVSGGLVIGSDASHAAAGIQSDVTVASTGSIGGFGHVDGNIDVLAGGHLAPGAPGGTLTVNGDLTLAQGSLIDASFGAPGPDFNTPGASHSVQVNGNLALNGAALTPIDAGGFGPGLYNLFNYTGALTQANGGISTPVGYAIQNLTGSKQINLINAQGIDLNIWNANGLASPTQMGGGSGVWSQVNANWTDATGSITGLRSPADAFVIFGGDAGTVTVDGAGGTQPVTTQGIQFASDGYHLNGDPLGLVAPSAGAYSEIRVGDGSAASAGWTATIDNVIAGNGLQKTGDGTLVLNGTNTYTQGTQLVAGTLSVSSDANLGNAGNAIDFEGGTLQVTGTAYTSTPRSIVFGAAGGGFDIADAANTFTVAQPLTGTGSLTKLGDGTLVLAGVNTYSGGTTVSAGTLQGDTASLQGNITDNASLVFNQGTDGTFAGVVSGAGSITKDGVGTLTLSGANSYAGGTTINAGALQGNTTSLQGNITDNASLIFNQVVDGTFASVISGTGALTKDGAGTLTLSGANSYSGGTTIDAGALRGDTTSLQGDITNNASLIFNQVANGSYSGAVSGTGSLTKDGAGTLTLSGANTYGGGTTVNAGALQGDTGSLQGNIVDNASVIFNQIVDGTYAGVVSGAGSLTKDGAGTLTLSGSNTYTGGTTISAGTLQTGAENITGNIVDNATLVFTGNGASSYGGVVSGSGELIKQGSGTLTLDGTHTYTGITLIDGGTLKIGAGGSLASSAGVGLAAGTTLDLSGSGNQSLGLLNGAGGTVDVGANTLTLTGTGNGSYAGSIVGTGALVKDGASTQTLAGANLYTGGTTVNDGTLVLGAGGSLAAGSNVTVNGAGVLDVSAAGNQALGNLNGSGGQVQLGGTTLGVGGGTYDGVIAGTGGLEKSGSGTLTLNGINTYTGLTQLTSGTLLVGDAAHGSASVQGDITVANTAVLGGFGQVNGNVDVQSGGHLAPGNPVGTFTVNGNLLAEQGSQLDFSFGVPGVNSTTPGQGHNVQVNGDLALEGATLNPSDSGGFGPGLYNLFNYTGTLTQANGGIIPPAGGYTIQYLTGSKQVNLITTAGMALSFWNANGLADPTRMGGGDGVWAQANANWTDDQGTITSTRVPVNAFVIFGGDAGTVTVDDAGGAQPVPTLGIQFASDGYHLNGDTLTLDSATQAPLSEIRVGDGSAVSANWTAMIDNVLVGAGINKTGLGTLVLNGANAYTQATQLTQGTLSVSSDANLGAPSAGIDFEGGTLRVTGTAFDTTSRAITLGSAGGGFDIADAANTFIVSQALAGTGGVTKLGDGTLVLTGANTYGGGTTISAGTLQGDSTSLQGNIADNAALVFAQPNDGTFTGVISGTGSVTKQGAGMLTLSGANTYAGGTTISAGTLAGNAASLQGSILNNGALIFNQVAEGTYQGSMTGTGTFTKTGQGSLLLTGQNAFAGTTSIEEGALEVGNASTPAATLGGHVTVQGGGTLLGSGTIHGDVTNNGIVHPGSSVGTLTIDGNFTQNAGGKFVVEIAADGTGSQLMVSGKASLAGSALLVMPSSNWQANADYRILTANGGVSGKFGLVNSNFAFVNPTLLYEPTSVGLSLQRNTVTFPSTATTRNGQAVATATEQLGPGNPVYDAIVIMDRPTAAAAFQQLQADIHASTRTAILDNDRYVRDAVNAHLSGTTSQASGSEAVTAEGGSVWTSVWGHWGDHESDGNATALSANGSGIALGADTSIGSAGRVGALVAKGQGTARSWTPDTSSRHVDSYAGLYADFRLDAFHLQAGAIYGWQKVTTNRFIAVENIRGSAGSRYDANTSQGYLEGSYEVGIGHSSLAPFLNIAYDHLSTDPIHEHGSVAAFNVDGEGSSITVGTLGARGNFQLNDDGGLRAIVSLGWQHAWGDVTPMNSMRYVAGGPSFTIAGVPVAKNAAAFTGGLSFLLAPKVSVDATYSGQFASHATDQAARLSLTWMF